VKRILTVLGVVVLCVGGYRVLHGWGWLTLVGGAGLVVLARLIPTEESEPEPEELPPTIDGRSEATGIVRYKMEDRTDQEDSS